MNLLKNNWLASSQCTGELLRTTPAQALTSRSAVDIYSPRPDFRSALYQFLIGLLQTTTPAKNWREWQRLYKRPPSEEELQAWFEPVAEAFELLGDGPRFMQDQALKDESSKPISELLIDAATGKTLKDNTDHFVKRGGVERISLAETAAALFCLQTNAPSGGAGYRTGLRGGGPLTTLILPKEEPGQPPATLWQKCWLNVMPRKEFLLRCNNEDHASLADRFPWLAATRVSDKTGRSTFQQDVHPDQMYWAMPRRIWLGEATNAASCDISGEESDAVISGYKAINYGVNYDGSWQHPLSPYSESKDGIWLPLHPQPGGITYRHWLAVTQSKTNMRAAAALMAYESGDKMELDHDVVVWACGYDLDNMKARGWQEATMPVFLINPDWHEVFVASVARLVEASQQAALYLRGALKDAWFKPKASVSGDFSFASDAFWSATEVDFYDQIQTYAAKADDSPEAEQTLSRRWADILARAVLAYFNQHIANAGIEFTDPKRISNAQLQLRKNLYGKKLRQTILQIPREAA